MPAVIDASAVLVGGMPASRVVVAGQMVTAVLGAPIAGGSAVQVEFLAAARITSPFAAGHVWRRDRDVQGQHGERAATGSSFVH